MVSEYFTIAQAAKCAALTEPQIRLRVQAGTIQADKVGVQWLISRAEVERLAEAYPLRVPAAMAG